MVGVGERPLLSCKEFEIEIRDNEFHLAQVLKYVVLDMDWKFILGVLSNFFKCFVLLLSHEKD